VNQSCWIKKLWQKNTPLSGPGGTELIGSYGPEFCHSSELVGTFILRREKSTNGSKNKRFRVRDSEAPKWEWHLGAQRGTTMKWKRNAKIIIHPNGKINKLSKGPPRVMRPRSLPLPRCEQSEKNFLGCCIHDPSLIAKHKITRDLFYEQRDVMILDAILAMQAKGLSIGDLEIWEHFKERGLREKINELCPSGSIFVYLGNLAYNAIQGNTAREVEKLRYFALRRQLWFDAQRLINSIEKESLIDVG